MVDGDGAECVDGCVDGGGFRCTQQSNSMGVGKIGGGTLYGRCLMDSAVAEVVHAELGMGVR